MTAPPRPASNDRFVGEIPYRRCTSCDARRPFWDYAQLSFVGSVRMVIGEVCVGCRRRRPDQLRPVADDAAWGMSYARLVARRQAADGTPDA